MKNWLKNLKSSEAIIYGAIISAIIGAIALIIAGCIAIQASMAPKRLEIESTQTAEAKQTALAPTSTQTIVRDWYVPFSITFPPNTWSEGFHSYLFNATCPDPINSTKGNESIYAFKVSSSLPLNNLPIYIRRTNLYSEPIGTDGAVDGVNPNQTTIAIYTPYLITYEDAQRAQAKCYVTVSVDGTAPIQLIPGEIQHKNDN